jgi:hypothetical protein
MTSKVMEQGEIQRIVRIPTKTYHKYPRRGVSSSYYVFSLVLLTQVASAADPEGPPQVVVSITNTPIHNKILVKAPNAFTYTSSVTPTDTETYDWSYIKELHFNPNGTVLSSSRIKNYPQPFPEGTNDNTDKDTENVSVTFTSSDGKGVSSDKRPLNFVAAEHFQLLNYPPPPILTTFKNSSLNKFEQMNTVVTYLIQDQFKDQLADQGSLRTASFQGNAVEVREKFTLAIDTFGIGQPQYQKTWLKDNTGTLPDNIEIDMKGIMLTQPPGGPFDRNLVGIVFYKIVDHVWQTTTEATQNTTYNVTMNTLTASVDSISADGQTAVVKTVYTVNTDTSP